MKPFTCFVLVGLLAIFVHYTVALSTSQLSDVFFANIVGYCTGMVASYAGHHTFTFFGSEETHVRRFPKFVLVSLTGLALSQLILFILVKFGNVADWQALLLSVGAVPPVIFLLNKHWVFLAREDK